jgi:hypothetical protein
LEGHFSKQVLVELDGEQSSTDGGALFLRTVDRRLRLTELLAGAELAQAEPQTLRLKLLKVAATKPVTARKIWAPLPRSHPLPSVFRQAHLALRCRPHQQKPLFVSMGKQTKFDFCAFRDFATLPPFRQKGTQSNAGENCWLAPVRH